MKIERMENDRKEIIHRNIFYMNDITKEHIKEGMKIYRELDKLVKKRRNLIVVKTIFKRFRSSFVRSLTSLMSPKSDLPLELIQFRYSIFDRSLMLLSSSI